MASLFNRIAESVSKALSPTAVGQTVAPWLYGSSSGVQPHEPFAGAWQRNLDQARSSGPNILANSAVFACIELISCDIARLPVRVLQQNYKGATPIGKSEFRNHPAWSACRHPNSFQTSMQFLQLWLMSKLTHGNTFVALFRDQRGVINDMYVLDPKAVQPLIATDGSVFYRVTHADGAQNQLAGLTDDDIIIPASNMIHDRGMCLFHPLVGVSPLFAAAASAMQGGRIQMNSDTFFANMSRSSGVLMAPGKIDPKVAQEMQTKWDQNYGGRGLGKVAVLSNGLKYEPMTITAADSELVAQLNWVVQDIARAYHVPGYKLGDLNKVTFKNAEQMSSDYLNNCLSYHIAGFEQCMNKAWGFNDDITVELDTTALFETETDLRYANYAAALNSGWMAINEVRHLEGLDPVDGGDEPRVQVQYVPLSTADGLPAPVAATKPVDPAPVPPAPPAAPVPNKPPAKSIDVAKMLTRFSQNLLTDEEGS